MYNDEPEGLGKTAPPRVLGPARAVRLRITANRPFRPEDRTGRIIALGASGSADTLRFLQAAVIRRVTLADEVNFVASPRGFVPAFF